MLLTPEQMQDARPRMEADLYELHTIVGQTVSNQAKLTETVAQLAGTVGDLGGKHDALTATVDLLASKVDILATTVDRYIRAQGGGHDGQP
jgi:hypothetical protein